MRAGDADPSFPINPSLHKLKFDTVKDFAPITLIGTFPLVLVVHPSVSAKDLEEPDST